MIQLSAFADEIAPDLHEQLDVLAGEAIHALDLRGAWGVNVLDLSDQLVVTIKHMLVEQQMKVAAIVSPIVKVAIDMPFEETLTRFERALQLAHIFQTPFIRIFSFYPSSTGQIEEAARRAETLQRLRELTRRASEAQMMLLHENEKDSWDDTIVRCVDLLESINDPHLQTAFDPANFLQCQQMPYPDAYEALRPWLRYVHVKVARLDGSIVAAGEGAARWPDLLQRLRVDGYTGFFSLSPSSANRRGPACPGNVWSGMRRHHHPGNAR